MIAPIRLDTVSMGRKGAVESMLLAFESRGICDDDGSGAVRIPRQYPKKRAIC